VEGNTNPETVIWTSYYQIDQPKRLTTSLPKTWEAFSFLFLLFTHRQLNL
jgi:hypothetical protein